MAVLPCSHRLVYTFSSALICHFTFSLLPNFSISSTQTPVIQVAQETCKLAEIRAGTRITNYPAHALTAYIGPLRLQPSQFVRLVSPGLLDPRLSLARRAFWE